MQVLLLWLATGMSIVTFIVHTFIGSPIVAGPLLKDESLPRASKWLNYYCWHIVTVYTFFMAGGYAYVALNSTKIELVVFLSILNATLSILSAAVAFKGHINPFRFPSTSLFASVALLGIISLVL